MIFLARRVIAPLCVGLACAVATAVAVCAVPLAAQDTTSATTVAPTTVPLTLQQVLAEAAIANAHLPIAALNIDIAQARLREAKARLFPRLSLEADLHGGLPQRYASSDGLVRLVGVDTVLGGGLRASRRVARFDVLAASAGYRVTLRDVELEVRLRYSEYEQAQREIEFRRAGLDRLQRYLTEIRSLQAAGQGLASDVLKTQVRLRTEEADVVAAQTRLDDARLELNELMGRVPDAPLALVPLPPPAGAPSLAGTPWRIAPDVVAAEAVRASMAAAVEITRAERRPQLTVGADVGAQPVFGNGAAPLNNGAGAGGEFTIGLSLPLWDAGVYRARLAQAQLAARLAGDSVTVVLRQSQLAWQRATIELQRLSGEVTARANTIPVARDAYLLAESLYNGGSGTTLDVLDSFSLWISANQAYADAVLRYRQAEAQYIRWGAP